MLTKQIDLVYDSQKIFMDILKTLSNPGVEVDLKWGVDKYGEYGVKLLLAVTFLDGENSFYISDRKIAKEIEFLTGSNLLDIENSDFLFLKEDENIEQLIENVKQGTFVDPHLSATVIIFFDECETKEKVTLYGVGISEKGFEIELTKNELKCFDKRNSCQEEYPCGVDLIFVRNNSFVFSLPRKTRRY